MQPIDPELFKTKPIDKPPRTASERAIKRADHVDQRDDRKKKFSLDDKKATRQGTKEDEKSEKLPSAFSLAREKSTKMPKQVKEREPNPQKNDENAVLAKEEQTKENVLAQSLAGDALKTSEHASYEASQVSASHKQQLQEMLKQLTDKITLMKQEGKTDLSLQVKHPPLFAGAKLTLTTFDSARGEFNLTFSELNAQAKQLLDMEVNREALMKHLEERGYTLHILVATTEKEDVMIAETETSSFEQQEQEKKDDQQKEKQDRE